MQEFEPRIVVSIPRQRLELIVNGEMVWEAPVSTSKYGIGSEEGSWKTPTGRFRICEKIGEGAPMRAVFKGRRWTGKLGGEAAEEDQILTRILWLDGLETENANTRERYIYFHGTNDEASIGTPASIGCVRLRNADMLALFEQVPVGAEVEIVPV